MIYENLDLHLYNIIHLFKIKVLTKAGENPISGNAECINGGRTGVARFSNSSATAQTGAEL